MTEDLHRGLISKEEIVVLLRSGLQENRPGVDDALLIACNAFYGVQDRSKKDYVLHLLRVFKGTTQSDTKVVVGILHDLVEDTIWTFDDLRALGFKESIVQAVAFVTHLPGENYFDTAQRCGTSLLTLPPGEEMLAIDVKLADLDHNMSVDRQTKFMSASYIDKLDAYIMTKNYLLAVKGGVVDPGTPVFEALRGTPLFNARILRERGSGDVPDAEPVVPPVYTLPLLDQAARQSVIDRFKARLGDQPADFGVAAALFGEVFFNTKDEHGHSWAKQVARVYASSTDSEKKASVGYLREIIAQGGWTLDELKQIGFDEKRIEAVAATVPQQDESYFEMIVRCGATLTVDDPGKGWAIDTMIAALSHEMNVGRRTSLLTPDAVDILQRDIAARNYLVAIKKGAIKSGMSMNAFMQGFADPDHDVGLKERLLRKFGSPARDVVQAFNAAPAGRDPAPAPGGS